jgi:hypothetical protein
MRLATLTLTLLAFFAGTATADLDKTAVLSPDGLGDVRVGLSEGEVEAVLGRKVKLQGPPESSCATAAIGHGAYALFSNGRLGRVTLQSRFWATRAGVRVGDTEDSIIEAYGKRAKRSKHVYAPDGSYFKVRRGKRKLVFETDGEKITSIHGGRRPEVDYVEACS